MERIPSKYPTFPPGVLFGAGALLAFTIAVAGVARVSHHNVVVLPPAAAVASRDLRFADLANGGIEVTDAGSGRLVATVQPETGGFLRGIMRGLVREHRLEDKAAHTAFRLTRWADGRLSIADPDTRESFELEAFGSTNEAVFARLLDEPRQAARD